MSPDHPMEVIAALDVDTLLAQEDLLRSLRGLVRLYKVGLRLFTAHGRRSVELVHRYGGEVFLDLKLHDIPQTVAHAVQEAQKMGVRSLSLHLMGGAAMLEAAAAVYPRPKLWGVTVLTSLADTDLKVLHPKAAVYPLVLRLAELGQSRHIDGIICSGKEVALLKKRLDPKACFITPGIRPAGHDVHDQKRAVTPAEAARLGIRYAVIGRPITQARDPRKAALDILTEIRNA